MVKKVKCAYCKKRTAKRFCPALGKLICPICCGENRLKNIDCDEGCPYLGNEEYQERLRRVKEFNLLLESVPHSEHDDIFKNRVAASLAYNFELFFADSYIKGQFDLTDNKVKEALTNLYYVIFKKQKPISDPLFNELVRIYNRVKIEYEQELIRQVILRIIISIKRMTGAQFGPCGYLNYLKDNLHPSSKGGTQQHIIELKDGRKYHYEQD